MGLIMYRLLPHFKYSWLAGAVTGGIFHVIGYTLVKIPLYGGGVAMAECFTRWPRRLPGSSWAAWPTQSCPDPRSEP